MLSWSHLTIASLTRIAVCQSYGNSSTRLTSQTTSSAVGHSSLDDTVVPLGPFILQGLGGSQSDLSTTTAISATTTFPSNALVTSFAPNTTMSSLLDDGWKSAQSCNSASVSWRRAHAFSGTNTWSTSTWVTTIVNETTIKPPNATATTLCDGYPRVEGSLASHTNTYVITSSTEIYGSASAVCQTDCPDCTLGLEACSKIWSSWHAYTSTNTSDISRSYSTPACSSPTPTGSTSNSYCHRGKIPCTFIAGPVRLVYFPIEVKGDRLCGKYSTVQPPSNSSTPVTAEAYGTTFTSGTAYISFESLRAFDGCGEPTGTVMSNFFLPLPSSDVSSMCGSNNAVFSDGPTSQSLNFADLEYPIATDVYKCQAKCLWGVEVADVWKMACRTIYDDYKPVLAYPSQVQQLQPEWDKCWFNPNVYFRYQQAEEYYLFDPPIALTQATSKVVPTLEPQPGHVTSTPVRQTSVVTSDAKGSERPEPASVSPVPESKPTSAGGQIPGTGDPGEAPTKDPASKPNSTPLAPGQNSKTVSPSSSSAGEAASVPAGLSVLTEALSKAIEPARPSPEGGDNPARPAQQTTPPSHVSVVTILSAVPTPATISRSGSNYIIDGQTIGSGTAGTIIGQIISVDPDVNGGLVFGQSSTLVLADGEATTLPLGAQAPISVVHDDSAWIVGEKTLSAGEVTIVIGQTLSVPSAGGSIVVDGEILLPNGDAAVATGIAAQGVTISRAGSDYVIDGRMVSEGVAATISGIPASVLSDGGGLAIGMSTISIPQGAATTISPAGMRGTDIEVSRDGSDFIVDGQTLASGEVATFNDLTVSVLSNGAGLVIGTSTMSLAPGAATTLTTNTDPIELEISRSGSMIIIDGQTLTASQSTIVDGEPVSVLVDAVGIVVGSRTISLDDDAFTKIPVEVTTSTPQTSATIAPSSNVVSTGENASGTATASQGEASRAHTSCGVAVLAVLLWSFVTAV